MPSMIELRFHGRGGQGVVTSAELLSIAAFTEGRHAQAFPSFGSERTGAPLMAFCRIDDRAIRLREPITRPDVVLVQDPTLLRAVDVFAGLREGGHVLVSTSRTPGELGLDPLVARLPAGHVLTVPAADIGRRYLGKPLPGAALLGALAALTGVVGLAALVAAIHERFAGDLGFANAAAARAAHGLIAAAHPEAA
jgi:pyruvate ferredoxin oxidoreductase gamma subunit